MVEITSSSFNRIRVVMQDNIILGFVGQVVGL